MLPTSYALYYTSRRSPSLYILLSPQIQYFLCFPFYPYTDRTLFLTFWAYFNIFLSTILSVSLTSVYFLVPRVPLKLYFSGKWCTIPLIISSSLFLSFISSISRLHSLKLTHHSSLFPFFLYNLSSIRPSSGNLLSIFSHSTDPLVPWLVSLPKI